MQHSTPNLLPDSGLTRLVSSSPLLTSLNCTADTRRCSVSVGSSRDISPEYFLYNLLFANSTSPETRPDQSLNNSLPDLTTSTSSIMPSATRPATQKAPTSAKLPRRPHTAESRSPSIFGKMFSRPATAPSANIDPVFDGSARSYPRPIDTSPIAPLTPPKTAPLPTIQERLPPPPTKNELDSTARAELIRRTRKLERILGETPQFIEEHPLIVTDPKQPGLFRRRSSTIVAEAKPQFSTASGPAPGPPSSFRGTHTPAPSAASNNLNFSKPFAKSPKLKRPSTAPATSPSLTGPIFRLGTPNLSIVPPSPSQFVALPRGSDSSSDTDSPRSSTSTTVSEMLALPKVEVKIPESLPPPPPAKEIFPVQKDVEPEAKHRKSRSQATKVHRHIVENVPELVVANTPEVPSKTGDETPRPPKAKPAVPERKERSADGGAQENKRANTDEMDAATKGMSAKDKALNVKRANKMVQVFGAPPPIALLPITNTAESITPSPSSSEYSVTPNTPPSPTVSTSTCSRSSVLMSTDDSSIYSSSIHKQPQILQVDPNQPFAEYIIAQTAPTPPKRKPVPSAPRRPKTAPSGDQAPSGVEITFQTKRRRAGKLLRFFGVGHPDLPSFTLVDGAVAPVPAMEDNQVVVVVSREEVLGDVPIPQTTAHSMRRREDGIEEMSGRWSDIPPEEVQAVLGKLRELRAC